MCKGYQRIHTGGWALESCSNNDSKSPLPDSVGTKRDASDWIWGFLFLRNDATSGWDGFDNKEDAAEMIRVVKVARGRSKQLSLLSLSELTPIGMLRI